MSFTFSFRLGTFRCTPSSCMLARRQAAVMHDRQKRRKLAGRKGRGAPIWVGWDRDRCFRAPRRRRLGRARVALPLQRPWTHCLPFALSTSCIAQGTDLHSGQQLRKGVTSLRRIFPTRAVRENVANRRRYMNPPTPSARRGLQTVLATTFSLDWCMP